MFKHQARYLVKRRRLELWAQVLVPDNLHRRQLIDQVCYPSIFTNMNEVNFPHLTSRLWLQPFLSQPILMMFL